MSALGAPPVVLLAHGSPDPRHAQGIEALAAALRARYAGPVHTAYLDHHAPRIDDVAGALESGSPVVVVPALLGRGYHWRVDVPAAAAALGEHVRVVGVLDDPQALRAAAVELATAHRWRGALVLIDDQGATTTVADGAAGEPVAAVARTLCAGVLADRALQQAEEAGLTPLSGELARTTAMADLALARATGNAAGVISG